MYRNVCSRLVHTSYRYSDSGTMVTFGILPVLDPLQRFSQILLKERYSKVVLKDVILSHTMVTQGANLVKGDILLVHRVDRLYYMSV